MQGDKLGFNETKPVIQDVTPTEVIQDQESSEKGSAEVSTAGGTVTYTRTSAEKRSRQDKGKAIMIESEPKKKSKKELEQERLSFTEAIRLEEQINEEQRAQIARDEEIARQWDECNTPKLGRSGIWVRGMLLYGSTTQE
ncbi:hypothetical protein Tco_0292746, partial [Tanacetum coccineum]